MVNPRFIRILSISDDFMVRSTRELVLRKDGYEIVSIGSDELLSISEIRSFDMAVLCHSVPTERAMRLLDRLHRYKPDLRVLRVNSRVPRIDPDYDVDSEVRSGPGALLKAVKDLLDGSAGAEPDSGSRSRRAMTRSVFRGPPKPHTHEENPCTRESASFGKTP